MGESGLSMRESNRDSTDEWRGFFVKFVFVFLIVFLIMTILAMSSTIDSCKKENKLLVFMNFEYQNMIEIIYHQSNDAGDNLKNAYHN